MSTNPIRIKRVYEQPSREDGFRILVERLWPRGLSKEKARIDLWLKDIAPSTELRRWFGHEASRWVGFRARYRMELEKKPQWTAQLEERLKKGRITFVYAAKDQAHNSALVLKEFIETPKA